MNRFSPRAWRAVWILLGAAPVVAQDNDWARTSAARPDVTIFSPLDLPSPNAQRTAAGTPGPEYWQQRADYNIDVSLDPTTRRVVGHEVMVYTNNSPDPLTFLWIALEQNLFREDSIGAKIAARGAIAMTNAEGDGCELKGIKVDGADATYSVYDTMGRIDLPKALAPRGGTCRVEIGWEFTVPEHVFRRFGIQRVKKGTVFEIAQWFPAAAVYDDVHGWNTLPYLGTGEFYSNYGSYDVSITVPREYLVVATGVLQNPADVYTEEQQRRLAQAKTSADTVIVRGADEVGDPTSRPAGDGPLTWRFHADQVRTFAWAASDAFLLDACGLGDVLVQSAYPEESLRAWSKSTQMLRAAIDGYSKRWHPYPYPVATNVSGAEGGMEYPMIIFCRGGNERGLFSVTAHEIGHNWFPMMVNSDERRHAWMDEGFNTFINGFAETEYFGGGGDQEPRRGRRRGGSDGAPMPATVPIDTPADQLSGFSLGMLEYMKTASGLNLLRNAVLGPERFDAAFRHYIEAWKFKSPQPADFYRCMENAAGADLAWFWRSWFVEATSLDQAIDNVSQATEKRPARVTITNRERMVMPVFLRATFDDDSTEDVELPVEIWFSSDRWEQRLKAVKPVKRVELDPDRRLPDAKRSNNVWEPQG